MNRDFLARDDVYNVCKGGSYERDSSKLEASSYGKCSARRIAAAAKCKQTFAKMKQAGKFETFRKHVSNGVKRHKSLIQAGCVKRTTRCMERRMMTRQS